MPRLEGNKYLLDQPLYDTNQLTAAANQTYSFFTVPLGQLFIAGVLKTYSHTNMVLAGTLEKGSTFTITGISTWFVEEAQGGAAVTLADAQEIMRRSHFNLLLGQVSFLRLPLAMIPCGGAGLYMNDTAAPLVEKGVVATQNRFHLANPIDIDEQEAIEVQVVVEGTPAAVTDLSVALWGNLVRPVR